MQSKEKSVSIEFVSNLVGIKSNCCGWLRTALSVNAQSIGRLFSHEKSEQGGNLEDNVGGGGEALEYLPFPSNALLLEANNSSEPRPIPPGQAHRNPSRVNLQGQQSLHTMEDKTSTAWTQPGDSLRAVVMATAPHADEGGLLIGPLKCTAVSVGCEVIFHHKTFICSHFI